MREHTELSLVLASSTARPSTQQSFSFLLILLPCHIYLRERMACIHKIVQHTISNTEQRYPFSNISNRTTNTHTRMHTAHGDPFAYILCSLSPNIIYLNRMVDRLPDNIYTAAFGACASVCCTARSVELNICSRQVFVRVRARVSKCGNTVSLSTATGSHPHTHTHTSVV